MKFEAKSRWSFIITMVLVAIVVSSCGGAQESKTYKVGLLSGVSTFDGVFEGFKSQMAELGFVEGENVVYDFKSADGDAEKITAFAQEFENAKVDLIVTTTTGAAKAAQVATADSHIPVIFTVIQDPVGVGLVDNLRSPGMNLTGIARPPVSYLGKRVEFLSQMLPDAKKIWILYDPDYSTAAASVPAVRDGAKAFGIQVVESHVKSPEDINVELQKAVTLGQIGDIDAIQLMPDTVNSVSSEAIIDFAEQHNIPVVGHTPGQVKYGALFTYADSNTDSGVKAAALAEKILRGANPGDLPVETSELFLTINLKAAQALGIEVSNSLLQAADEIIR